MLLAVSSLLSLLMLLARYRQWLLDEACQAEFMMMPGTRTWFCTYQGIWPLHEGGSVYYGDRYTCNKACGRANQHKHKAKP